MLKGDPYFATFFYILVNLEKVYNCFTGSPLEVFCNTGALIDSSTEKLMPTDRVVVNIHIKRGGGTRKSLLKLAEYDNEAVCLLITNYIELFSFYFVRGFQPNI